MEDFLVTNWDSIVTISLTLYSAILSTATTILAILLFYKDRAIIQIKLSKGFLVLDNSNEMPDVITITIINSGRRDLEIRQLFMTLQNDKSMLFLSGLYFYSGGPDKLPIRLVEHSEFSSTMDARWLMGQMNDENGLPKWLGFTDATGKTHKQKIPKKFWKSLKKNLER
jgi:hypothetical protein